MLKIILIVGCLTALTVNSNAAINTITYENVKILTISVAGGKGSRSDAVKGAYTVFRVQDGAVIRQVEVHADVEGYNQIVAQLLTAKSTGSPVSISITVEDAHKVNADTYFVVSTKYDEALGIQM